MINDFYYYRHQKSFNRRFLYILLGPMSRRFQPNLSHWLLYSSALDVSQDMYSADWGHGSKRLSDGLKAGNEGLSMTLDRPPKTTGTGTQRSAPVRTKLSSYPPVLGYLATLTRSKASKQLRRQNVVVIDDNGDNGAFKDAKENNESGATTPADQLLADRSGAVRRLSGLFTKHSATTGQRDSPATMTAAKIKNKLSAAPGILKTALFRSRSKDSFLDSSFQESTTTAAEAPWQHKSSVPCYVGWRPPMPLPKDCPVTDPAPRSSTVRRVVRTESRRSNLGWRKYSSESDLLDASESGYMAIDRVPVLPSAWPPTLALLTPIFGRFEGDGSSYSRADNGSSGPSTMPHTLPRKFQSDWLHASSPSLRVQFNLEQQHELPLKKAQAAAAGATPAAGARTSEARQVKAEFEEYSLRLKQRLKLAEGSSHCNQLDRLSDENGDQRCGPWYDLWTPDPSVRLCEIAQL